MWWTTWLCSTVVNFGTQLSDAVVVQSELLIIGAGPAGLALARHYSGNKRLVERESEVGGLCRSFEMGGGVFDIGGHSFHTPHAEVDHFVRTLMGKNWNVQPRDARVYFNGELIPYPFQQNFDKLRDINVIEECRHGARSDPDGAANFEDWIVARFGAGVATHFMLPYNRKLWARDLRRMSCEWVGERVADSSVRNSAKDIGKRRPLQSNSWIGYPAHGGFGEIYKTMAKGCGPIEFNCNVIRIDPNEKTLECKDGRVWHWGRLASTMPVPLLLKSIQGTPPSLQERADQLESVALRVLMILVANPLPNAPQRIYVSHPAIPLHKAAFNHTSSESLRQRPMHAIMCEISHSTEKPLPSDVALESATTEWLLDAGLVPSRGDIAQIVHFDAMFGYPVYTHDRVAIMGEIRAFLEAKHIYTLGRFGRWEYANSDECIRQGMELACQLAAAHSF
jgi:protoporphyrinogen oxidase